MRATAEPPSYEHTILPGNIRLAVNSNKKLKTIFTKVYSAANLDESVTQRAVLPMILRRGTRRLPDMQKLNRHLESLYGAGVYGGVSKVGEWHVSRFSLDIVNDLFLPQPEDLLEKGLQVIRDLIFDPLVVDGGFHGEYLEQEKANLRRNIESLIDDKASYASFRCVEVMCRDEPYRLNEQGSVEDIEKIQPGALYEQYVGWRKTCPLAIYVAGDLGVRDVQAMVAKIFRVERGETVSLPPLPSRVAVCELKEVKERLDVQQGKLILGFRHGVTYTDESYEALLLMNGILGGFSHSKLFQNVREKASLAYSASSSLERTKGLLFVSCGIDVDKYERAVNLTLEQVEAMKRGEISDEELEATVKTILNHNRMLEDNFSGLAEVDYVWGLHGRKVDLPAFRRKLPIISKDAITDVARKLEHDTTYFLHG